MSRVTLMNAHTSVRGATIHGNTSTEDVTLVLKMDDAK